ncbi:MAG: tetratricopeptide repeat protein, partial [Isosphaeraceae bacterium]
MARESGSLKGRDRQSAVAAAEELGDRDPALALCLSGLAVVYGRQARDGDAMPLLRRALRIREEAFGPDHPEVAK